MRFVDGFLFYSGVKESTRYLILLKVVITDNTDWLERRRLMLHKISKNI